MTDGTSQGLFVVVAIVIFGIFVSLSYTVFGNGGLTDSVVGLVQEATYDIDSKVGNWDVLYAINSRRIISNNLPNPNGYQSNIRLQSDLFEQDGEYVITFDLTVNEGVLYRLGGHYHIGDTSEVHIGNRKYNRDSLDTSNPWRFGFDLAKPIEQGETIKVKLILKTDRYDNPTHENKSITITPDRLSGNSNPYDLTIENLVFYKTN